MLNDTLGRRGLCVKRSLADGGYSAVVAALLFLNSVVAAADPLPALADIQRAVIAADAQFTDLAIESTTEWPPDAGKGPDTPKFLFGRYLMKFPEGWECERQVSTVAGRAKQDNLESPARVVAFDGKTTLYLSEVRDKRSGNAMASISPGRASMFSGMGNPHHMIWRWGPNDFKWVFTSPGNKWDSAVSSDRINGDEVVRVNGTIDDGTIKVNLWLCPTKSFTPVRVRLADASNHNTLHEREFADFIKLDNGLWYPRIIRSGSNVQKPEMTITMRLTSIKTARLTLDAFHPELPAKTKVTNHITGQVYTTDHPTTAPADAPDPQPE